MEKVELVNEAVETVETKINLGYDLTDIANNANLRIKDILYKVNILIILRKT